MRTVSRLLSTKERLVGQVVKASASRTAGPGVRFLLAPGVFGSNQTSDFKIGTPVVSLPGACYTVSAGTGWPGVSIL